jgi:hypothetical protein
LRLPTHAGHSVGIRRSARGPSRRHTRWRPGRRPLSAAGTRRGAAARTERMAYSSSRATRTSARRPVSAGSHCTWGRWSLPGSAWDRWVRGRSTSSGTQPRAKSGPYGLAVAVSTRDVGTALRVALALRRAPSGSTPTTSGTPPCPSAGSRIPGSAGARPGGPGPLHGGQERVCGPLVAPGPIAGSDG